MSIVYSLMEINMEVDRHDNNIRIFKIPAKDVGPTPIPYLKNEKYHEIYRVETRTRGINYVWFVASIEKIYDKKEAVQAIELLTEYIKYPDISQKNGTYSLNEFKEYVKKAEIYHEKSTGEFLNDLNKNKLLDEISDIFKSYSNEDIETNIIIWAFLNPGKSGKLMKILKQANQISRGSKLVSKDLIEKSLSISRAKKVLDS